MTCWSGDCSAVGGPTRKTGELSEHVELIVVFFPLLEVFGDHPPAIVEDLGVVFVGAEELGDVLLQEFLVVVFFQPSIEFGAIAVQMRVPIELFDIGLERLLGGFLDPLQLFVRINESLSRRQSFRIEATGQHRS